MRTIRRSIAVSGFLLLAVWPCVGAEAPTFDDPVPVDGHGGILFGEAPSAATRDTVLLMGPWGSGAPFNGQFETTDGTAAWNDWTHIDLTQKTESFWHVDSYRAEGLNGHGEGNLAVWCGSLEYPACTEIDPEGGYGNDYDERLEWTRTVPDATVATIVTVEAWLNCDLEPGYDFLNLEIVPPYDDQGISLWETDGTADNFHLQTTFTCQPGHYGGENGDELRLRFHVTSDGGWSDADCSYPSAGACQIDDISVTLEGGAATFDDFQDDTLGSWEVGLPQGAGDFAALRMNLNDLDPCRSNSSPQVTFIDDGEVVPGTGGSLCINWCYGPGGYIVTTTGGLGDYWTTPIYNATLSPVMPWPDGKEGCLFSFDVYVHEDLSYDAPGIFYVWSIRSTASPDAAQIEQEPWRDRNYVYYGLPEYRRVAESIGDLVEPGARFVQVQLGVYHLVYIWAWCPCNDGYPAPYFDNVRVEAYDHEGPSLLAFEQELGQDRFPASGGLDLADPGANSVRFDAAHLQGDSLVVYSEPLAADAVLAGPPVMHYRLSANPLFDPYRHSGLPGSGQVTGLPHPYYPEKFSFDLPDSGFLFPGDVLHYCFSSTENLSGQLRTTWLPADTTGFSHFDDPMLWPPAFTMRALPSVRAAGEAFEMPEILVWDGSGDAELRDEWHYALANLGLVCGRDWDLFRVAAPEQAENNGLGALATLEQIQHYAVMAYGGGGQDNHGLGYADAYYDPTDDLGLLDAWLRLGGRGLLLTGDRVAERLSDSETGFLEYWAGAAYESWSLRELIDDQYAPDVAVLPQNPVLEAVDGWRVNAMCPSPVTLNAVTPAGTGVMVAAFTDPDGNPSAYPWAAAVYNAVPEFSAQTVFLPCDFARLGTLPEGQARTGAPLATRSIVMGEILGEFGQPLGIVPAAVPDATHSLAARACPNPFNPRVRVEFDLPRRSAVSLRIYDVRGRAVATLIDEIREAGPGRAIWAGDDEAGRPLPSGTYFYRLQAGPETLSGKLSLLR